MRERLGGIRNLAVYNLLAIAMCLVGIAAIPSRGESASAIVLPKRPNPTGPRCCASTAMCSSMAPEDEKRG